MVGTGINFNYTTAIIGVLRSNKVPKFTRGLKKRKKDSILGWVAAPFVVASICSDFVKDSALSPLLPAIHQ
jgi:hypothetical protein